MYTQRSGNVGWAQKINSLEAFGEENSDQVGFVEIICQQFEVTSAFPFRKPRQLTFYTIATEIFKMSSCGAEGQESSSHCEQTHTWISRRLQLVGTLSSKLICLSICLK
jgi:hypothetical protein